MGDIEELERPEMLSEELKRDLHRQAYRVVGSHSAVKLCDWLKKNLREEDAVCYKHTFYGINTGCCMQMTLSCACANRCIFCWRHQNSPIIREEWKWQLDSPEELLEGALEAQHKLVWERKGHEKTIPAQLERALTVKHCALSLVGEPIVYPRMAEYLELLHARGISSFLVTNGQHPDALEALPPVTQLYLSVDASNPAELIRIDRPAFKDSWDRLLRSLDILATRPDRTVIRITAIRHENMEPEFLEEYATLINRGRPDFIEVKGMSFVGQARQSLDWENFTTLTQMVAMVKTLLPLLPDYELLSVHPRSRCFCLARSEFRVDGVWRTWLDFDTFCQLAQDGNVSKMAYSIPTPEEWVHNVGMLDSFAEADRAPQRDVYPEPPAAGEEPEITQE